MSRASDKDRWAYFLRHASELTMAEIGRFLADPAFVEAGGVLDVISKTEEERLRYELRVKALRDHATDLEVARLEGNEEGQWRGRIQLLQELLGETISTAEDFRGWDVERLKCLAESLQTRLRGRP